MLSYWYNVNAKSNKWYTFYKLFSHLLHEVDLACEEIPEETTSTENTNETPPILPISRFDNVLLKTKIFYNSCTNSNENGETAQGENVTDTKFESLLLSCTSDDQKKIKNR